MLNYIKDWNTIEASFQYEYGIDLTKTTMSMRRFSLLVNNSSPDSPIGRLISIRTTPDKELNKEQLKYKRSVELVPNAHSELKSSSDFQSMMKMAFQKGVD